MRNAIRRALTKTVRIKKRQAEMPPNEKLVYGMYFTIAALIGLIILEVAHMAFLGSWNSEIFAAITALIGTITGIFISQKA